MRNASRQAFGDDEQRIGGGERTRKPQRLLLRRWQRGAAELEIARHRQRQVLPPYDLHVGEPRANRHRLRGLRRQRDRALRCQPSAAAVPCVEREPQHFAALALDAHVEIAKDGSGREILERAVRQPRRARKHRRRNIAAGGKCHRGIARQPVSGQVRQRHQRCHRPPPVEVALHRAARRQRRPGPARIAHQRQRRIEHERFLRHAMRKRLHRQALLRPASVKRRAEGRLHVEIGVGQPDIRETKRHLALLARGIERHRARHGATGGVEWQQRRQ